MSNDAAIIRTILAQECSTVNEYESLAKAAENPAIQELVNHLAKEEKEHIAECVHVLRHLDPQFDEMMKKDVEHALGDAAHTLIKTAPSPPAPSTGAPQPQSSDESFSVHGLKTVADPGRFTIGDLAD